MELTGTSERRSFIITMVGYKMIYCTKCGAQLNDDSFFCEHCGARIPVEKIPPESITKKTEQEQLTSKQTVINKEKTSDVMFSRVSAVKTPRTSRMMTDSVITPVPSRPIKRTIIMEKKKNNNRTKILIAVTIIIFVLIAGISGLWFVGNTIYNEVASFGLIQPIETSQPLISLNWTATNAKIHISSSSSIDAAFIIDARVFAPSFFNQPSEHQYETPESYQVDDSSGTSWQTIEFSQTNDAYRYEFSIVINPAFKLRAHVEVDVGDVTIDLSDIELLRSFYIDCNVGNIEGKLQNVSMRNDVYFDLLTDTGSIDLSWEEGTIYSLKEVVMTSDAGSISVELSNINATTSIPWQITTNMGSIAISLTDKLTYPQSQTINHSFDVQTDTGSINLNLLVSNQVGIEVFARTSIGSIVFNNQTIDQDTTTYQSNSYIQAPVRYDFSLRSDVGSISVSGMP